MKLFILTLLLICSSFTAVYAQQETHGGDGFATEFFRIYSDLRMQIPQEKMALPHGKFFAVEALDKMRPQLTVVSYPNVFWNGKEVSARSIPAKSLIELSQAHWPRLSYEQKLALVLHEVLPIAGWIDNDYAISSAILKEIDIHQASLSLRTLASALLSCNTRLLQSFSAGQYQSFLQDTRAELIHLSVMSSCEYFLRKTIEFSSLEEVQRACDKDAGQTPFETLVNYAIGAPPREQDRFMRIFDLLYTRPKDGVLACKWENRVQSRGTVCETLRKKRTPSDEMLNRFSAKADCH